MWSNIVGPINGLQQEYDERHDVMSESSMQASKIRTKMARGCILAHCMGLGKTFSVVAFTVTLLTHPGVSVVTNIPSARKQFFSKVLVVAPLNTIANWSQEYKKWTPSELREMVQVVIIDTKLQMNERVAKLKKWYENGGVFVYNSYD